MKYIYTPFLFLINIALLFCLPIEAQTVGSVKGNLSLSATGGATYSIPMACPTGINGMHPQISLEYNSQCGNGIAGWGWNIGGTSSISRSAKNKYLSDKSSTIALDSTDLFMLDGNYLIKKQEWGTDSIEYRLETDPSSRIRAYDITSQGPSTFKVEAKDGRTLYYGDPTTSTSYAQLYSNASSKSGAVKVAWNLYKVSDKDGNYMDITYINDLDGKIGNAIRKISYGGNVSAQKAPDLTLSFDYEARTDSISGYISGHESLQQLRLTKVTGAVNGVTQKEYRLAYASGAISHLSSVTLYDNNIQQYKPLTFVYGDSCASEKSTDVSFVETNKDVDQLSILDLDGDGQNELCDFSKVIDSTLGVGSSFLEWHRKDANWINSSHLGFNVSTSVLHVQHGKTPCFADFNSNGSMDDYFAYNDGNDYHVTITDRANDSILYENVFEMKSHQPFVLTGNIIGYPQASMLLIDNFPISTAGGYYYEIIRIAGRPNGIVNIIGQSQIDNRYFIKVPSKIKDIRLLPLSGLPFCDDLFVILEDGSNRILVNKQDDAGYCFIATPKIITTSLHLAEETPHQFVDLNVDGLIDVIYRSGKSDWKIAYNRGDYTFTEKPISIDCNSCQDSIATAYDEKDYIYASDINNDGLIDLIIGDELVKRYKTSGEDVQRADEIYNYYFDKTAWKFYLNTGSGYELVETKDSPKNSQIGCLGDLSGTGNIDFVYEPENEKVQIVHLAFTPPHQNLITKITTGMDVSTQLVYRSHLDCTDPLVKTFERTSLSQYLKQEILPIKSTAFTVLAECSSELDSLSYTYGTLLYNWTYRGLMGFRYHASKDLKKNRQTFSFNEIYAPTVSNKNKYFLLSPQYKRTYSGNYGVHNDGPICSEEYEYDYTNTLGEFCIFPRLTKSTLIDLMQWNKQVNINTYDVYNNITSSTLLHGNLYNCEFEDIFGSGVYERKRITYGQKNSWYPNDLVQEEMLSASFKEADEGNLLVDSVSRINTYTYDANGRLVREIDDAYNKNARTTEYKLFDLFGHPLVIETSANGLIRRDSSTYSTSGRFIINKTNALNETTEQKWDEKRELLTSSVDRMGKTYYMYNSYSNIYRTTFIPTDNSSNGRTDRSADTSYGTTELNSDAVYYSSCSATGQAKSYIWYDKYGREVVWQSKLRSKDIYQFTEYNKNGLISRKSKKTYHAIPDEDDWETVNSYDSWDRIVKIVTPSGTTSYKYDYDCYNLLVTTVTSPIEIREIKQNEAGQIQSSTVWDDVNGDDKIVTFYNGVGNRLRKVTPSGCQSVLKNYDQQGNCIEIIDPDAGTTNYEYDGWGNLIKESQAIHLNGDITTTEYKYSAAGLLQYKKRGEEMTTYTYDSNHRVINIRTTGPNFYSRSFQYDTLDREIQRTDSVTSSLVLTTKKEYNSAGRVNKITYPSGYSLQLVYDNEYLRSIYHDISKSIWYCSEYDAEGRVLKEKKGNVITQYTYNAKGQLVSSKAPGIINRLYTYDEKTGNIVSCQDSICNQQETFTYDNLDRLKTWRGGNNTYSSTGDIVEQCRAGQETSKSIYGDIMDKQHVLQQINLKPYYATDDTVEYAYNDFKKLERIKAQGNKDSINYNYKYGIDEQRSILYGDVTRYYSGDYEREGDSNPRHVHYIYCPTGLAAIYISNKDSAALLNAYVDRQGSLIALTHDAIPVQRFAYDPWGVRRNPYNWDLEDSRTSFIVSRGYTMHEHIDRFKLINMDGRIFDPYTQLFLSPDPFIQASDNWMNYNRYAYCLNNPLKYTDPTGHCFIPFIAAFVMNWAANGFQLNIDGLASGLAGLASAGAFTGIGALVSSAIAPSFGGGVGFWNGAASAAISGFAAGFTVELASSLIGGNSFSSAFSSALSTGATDALFAGVVGGIEGGIRARAQKRSFWYARAYFEKSYGDRGYKNYYYSTSNNCVNNCISNLSDNQIPKNILSSEYSQYDSKGNFIGIKPTQGMKYFEDHMNRRVRCFDGTSNAPFPSEKSLLNNFTSGYDFSIQTSTSEIQDHLANVNKITQVDYLTLSGKRVSNLFIYLQSPGQGNYIKTTYEKIKNSLIMIYKIAPR